VQIWFTFRAVAESTRLPADAWESNCAAAVVVAVPKRALMQKEKTVPGWVTVCEPTMVKGTMLAPPLRVWFWMSRLSTPIWEATSMLSAAMNCAATVLLAVVKTALLVELMPPKYR